MGGFVFPAVLFFDPLYDPGCIKLDEQIFALCVLVVEL